MATQEMATRIPTNIIGPIHFNRMHGIRHHASDVNIEVPLATYETTLFHSVGRGAKVTRLAGTLKTVVLSDFMTRSLLFEAPDAHRAHVISSAVESNIHQYQDKIVSKQSRHAKLIRIDSKIIGTLIYLRLTYETGDASGHNMTTFASDKVAAHITTSYPELSYISVSGNYCVDKKVSAVNGILGRGKSVIAEITIPRKILEETLRTTPEKMVELNIKKNLVGSIASGGLMSANAHYANMLLAFYLATGQDAANIVEGSQGITHMDIKDDCLYMSVNLPNIIVGSVGHGKDTEDVLEHLRLLDAKGPGGAEKLAHIAAAVVLCGELSLMAALTNNGELSASHKRIERTTS